MRPAYTLVEVLGVVALVGASAAVIIGSLVSSTSAAALEASTAAVREADRLARAWAQMGTSVTIAVEDGALAIRRGESAPVVVLLPSHADVEFHDDRGNPVEHIRVDRRSWTREYQVRVTIGEQGWVGRISGLTGWSTRFEQE